MATYTVKAGDNLSSIARSLGLKSYNELSGYRSGNPNLIYAGEVLNYGSPTPAPSAPAPAPAPASNPILDFAAKSKAESDALLARQKAEQEGLFTNYEKIRNNQEALPALYSRLQNEAGIPGLSQASQAFKDEIYKTKDRIDRLAEDVLARTTGTLTTEAQRRRLQSSEEEPLQTNLGRLGTGLAPIADMLSSANQSVSTQMQLQTQQQERELEGVKLRINAISDRFARELTGFTSNKETQLTGILDQLERDRFLSDRDWKLAQDLAAEERSFSRQKALAAQQLSAYSTGGGSGTSNTPTISYTDWANGGNYSTAQNTRQAVTTSLPTVNGVTGPFALNNKVVTQPTIKTGGTFSGSLMPTLKL